MSLEVVIVRAKPHGIDREEQFLKGVASIGWPVEQSLKGKNRSEIEEVLKKEHKNISTLTITQVFTFSSIPKGSIILTPSYQSREIHIFEAISDYEYKKKWYIDKKGNPHTILVSHLKTVPRNVFSFEVQKALLASKKTITRFTKYSEEIQLIAYGKEKVSSVSLSDESLRKEIKTSEDEANNALRELLNSSNEEIKLQAALALLGK